MLIHDIFWTKSVVFVKIIFKWLQRHSVHPPLFTGMSWTSNQIFKKGGLARPQLLDGGCWERGDFFQREGGCNSHIKNKLKSETFNDKKFISKNIFLCHY